jgi:hypothetical protein
MLVGVQQYPDYTQSNSPQVPEYVAFGNLVQVVMDMKASLAAIENGIETLVNRG